MILSYSSADFGINTTSLYIIQSGYAKIVSTWEWEMKVQPYTRLYYMEDGEAQMVIDNKEVTLKKGHVYLLPTGHSVKNIGQKNMHQLYFHIKLYDFANYDILANCKVCDGISVDYIPELVKLYKSDNIIDTLKLKQFLISDCLKFLTKSGCEIPNSRYSPTIRKTIDYIKNNLCANLSVKKICSDCLISKSTLNSYFKKELGKTVGEYIDEQVFEQSKIMLINEMSSLSEISDKLGFCDYFYFSRRFKEKYGITPSAYRKNYINYNPR